MGSVYSKELADMLQKYIDDKNSVDENKLRQLLQETSADGRYKLLAEVKGSKLDSLGGIWMAAWANDINTLKFMMDGFTPEQAATANITYALRRGASRGSTEVVEYLLALLDQDQRVDLLMKGDPTGDTALHGAIKNKHLDTAHVILASVEPSTQMKLLQIKNKKGQSVEDLPTYSLLTPTQVNAEQQRASAKKVVTPQTEVTKQKEDTVEKKRASVFVDNAEKETVSTERTTQHQADKEGWHQVFGETLKQLGTAIVEQQRPSAKDIIKLRAEMARQERAFTQRISQQEDDNAEQKRGSAERINQIRTEMAKQERAFTQRINQQEQENAEKERASAEKEQVLAERVRKLEADNAEQQRVSAERINQLQAEMARQERAFTQRVSQQEEDIQRLVENFNRFEVYLRTPEVCDARGDQEIEDNH